MPTMEASSGPAEFRRAKAQLYLQHIDLTSRS